MCVSARAHMRICVCVCVCVCVWEGSTHMHMLSVCIHSECMPEACTLGVVYLQLTTAV